MFGMSKSESITQTSYWSTPSIAYTRMEVGCSDYWFYHKITEKIEATLIYYGSDWQVDKIDSFYTSLVNV